MRTVVTGGCGFIGSHLCEQLLRDGHDVVAVDDLSTGSPVNILGLLDHPRFRFIRASVLDAEVVDQVVAECDRVYHLAAAVGVCRIVDHPLDSLRTNLTGTQCVLDAVLRHDRRVLLTSTSEVYGKNAADQLDEEADRVLGTPFTARWSYAAAKALDELVARTYWQDHGLRVVVARLFNTVGPRQTGRYGMVVPRLVRQALQGEALTVHGDGTQTRCFCHVADVVPALITLLETPAAYGHAVNLGNPVETSILALAHRVRELAGTDGDIRFVSYQDAYGDGYEDMRRRIPDIAKAQRLIAFAPARDLDHIITDVIADVNISAVLEGRRWRDAAQPGAAPAAPAASRNGHGPAPIATSGAPP